MWHLPATCWWNPNSIDYAHNQLAEEDKEEHHEIEGAVTPVRVQCALPFLLKKESSEYITCIHD